MWFSFFVYSVLTALLPGPNNILALNKSMTVGYKNAKILLWGIYAGFTLVIFLCALFTEFLLSSFQDAMLYLKYAGALYLIYLAWSVISSKPLNVDEKASPEGVKKNRADFWKGLFLQLVNVKIIIYGITAFSSFVLPHYQSSIIILSFAVFLSFVGSFATFLWAVAGENMALFLNKHFKIVNIVMGLLLLYCALSLFL